MMDNSTKTTEEASGPELAPAKKAYEKPVLTRLGALRELTMTKSNTGGKDGKNNRFTGRGGRHLISDSRS